MKKAACEACDERLEGTTSFKMKRLAIKHWDETGHRTFRKILGWGNYTLPPHPENTYEVEASKAEAYEVVTMEDLDEARNMVTQEDLIRVLRDYVPRNTFKDKMTSVIDTVARMKTFEKAPAEASDVALDAMRKHVDESCNAISNRIAGMRDAFDAHVDNHPEVDMPAMQKRVRLLEETVATLIEDRLGDGPMVNCIRCNETELASSLCNLPLYEWRKGSRDQPPHFESHETTYLCHGCAQHMHFVVRVNKGDGKHAPKMLYNLMQNSVEAFHAIAAHDATEDVEVFNNAVAAVGGGYMERP